MFSPLPLPFPSYRLSHIGVGLCSIHDNAKETFISSTGEVKAVLPGPAEDIVTFKQDAGRIMCIKEA